MDLAYLIHVIPRACEDNLAAVHICGLGLRCGKWRGGRERYILRVYVGGSKSRPHHGKHCKEHSDHDEANREARTPPANPSQPGGTAFVPFHGRSRGGACDSSAWLPCARGKPAVVEVPVPSWGASVDRMIAISMNGRSVPWKLEGKP
jgi:hypothetical protein